MSRLQFFIVTSAVIFVLERILPLLVSWPVFIFPVFVILFLLTGKSDAREIPYIVLVALIFDFFSGYRFGVSTIAILVLILVIFLFKTHFAVEPRSFFPLAAYVLLFSFVYFALLSFRYVSSLFIQAPVIIIETLILFLIFNFLFRGVKT